MRIAIGGLQPGMVLAEDIRSNGRVLYHIGDRISKSDIKLLRSMKIRSVQVQEESAEALKRKGLLTDETREHAVEEVRRTYQDFHLVTPHRFDAIRKVGEQIVEDVLESADMDITLQDLRTHDDYTYHHSVNVAAVSISLGSRMGLPTSELRQLAAGALMHDIGKMKIPELILRKQTGLNSSEREYVNRHPEWGFDILAEQTASDPVIWGVAHQHHEAMDGSGYPSHRKGRQVHPWARIVMVADIWDALRSDRPYKPAWTVDESQTHLNSVEMERKLDPDVLQTLNELVAQPQAAGAPS